MRLQAGPAIQPVVGLPAGRGWPAPMALGRPLGAGGYRRRNHREYREGALEKSCAAPVWQELPA